MKKIVVFSILVLGLFLISLAFVKRNKEHYLQFIDERKKAYTTRKKSRYCKDIFGTNAFSIALDENYKYSRFYTFKTWEVLKTSVGYYASTVVLSFILMILSFFIFKKPVVSMLICIATAFGGFMFLYILRFMNNKSVENDLTPFLNMLGNYSTGNSEVMSIFLQIAPKVGNPLRDCLFECVNESQNIETGSIKALMNLENKIESDNFKEIIENIIVSIRYSSGFSAMCTNERKVLNISLAGKKKLQECVIENSITMVLCVGLMLVMFGVLGKLLNMNIFIEITTTVIGNIVLGIVGTCIAIFAVAMLKVNK